MAPPTYMFIAGDPSGDRHSAAVIKNLQNENPSCRCIGIGGPAMKGAGFTSLLPFEPFNRMGFIEVIAHLPFFLKAQTKLVHCLGNEKPDCLVCVDYSGFNIPIMKTARKMGIPVVWYIAPMVWAWKKHRATILARYASHICCIFPFEVPFFLPYTDRVSFVGNPLAEDRPCMRFFKYRVPDNPLLAIIPGSRPQEVTRILQPMVGAYKLLKTTYPALRATVSRYASLPEDLFIKTCKGTDIEIHNGSLSDLLLKTDIALVTSGTATLETALMGIPHVIVYKTSPITYTIFKHFATISSIGLPNIIAGETVAPECIQRYVTEKELAERVIRFLSDESLYRKTAERLLQISDLLGAEKPSHAVADIIRRCSLK
ncbi:MAG: lipid-A-disaccharide synthase [Chitinispirillaceae bacterium]|nr:lipid-A-disaccharide synthase [Chitinispirillaceae bacterium]